MVFFTPTDWDCERDGHFWTDRDPCRFCGLPWSEVYDVVLTRHSDGSVSAEVVPVDYGT